MCNYECHLTRLFLVCACLLTACGGSDGSSVGPPPGGNSHPFDNPTGTPFTLPSGIAFVGPVATNSQCGATLGTASDLVNVCVTLRNETGVDSTVVFPAGLILISQDTAVQGGTQVQEQRMLIRAGSDTTFYWPLYCLHAHRATSSDGDLYAVGPTSNHAGLREIISLVAGKDLSTSTFLVQTAIWEVSDGAGLTAPTRGELQAIP